MVWFLGLISLLWFIDHFIAAILSFPNLAKWKRSFTVHNSKNTYKFTFRLHRAIGLWLFPVTLIISVSGLYLNWTETIIHTMEWVSPITPRYNARAPYLKTPLYSPVVSFEKAADIARAHNENALDMATYFPWQGLYLFRGYDESHDIDTFGRRFIAVDAKSGNILDDFHYSSGSAGDVFLLWQYPLHSGKAFGWFGRIIIFFTGIAVTALGITGLMIWWRKYKVRQLSG
ncbi:MAG: PepSY domain-containing protein [Emcibacteraceae bacterium]|nr:PepSY domain-containing protein [Emcibacteraceae bacterium]